MFDLQRLASATLVAHIDYHESLGSTSDRALALAAAAEAPLPLLVLTNEQTAGRGRGASRWLASTGSLTFSLALHAPPAALPLDRWPLVALVAGLATCCALKEHAPAADLRLKWPNDILLAGRKLCGILSESVPGWRDRLVVGIGVNVNNRLDHLEFHPQTPGLQLQATSLLEHDRIGRDLTTLLISILDHFDHCWSELLAGQQEFLLAAFRERCFLTGRTVTIEQPVGKRVVGMCQGIDERGRLTLQTSQGLAQIASGTVVSWEP